MRRALLVAPLALLAGCGGGAASDSGDPGPARTSVERVIVQAAPSGRAAAARADGFDAEGVYRRAAPGVVTVVSVFGGQSLDSLFGEDPGGRGQAGQGSGFVVSSAGEVATNAHVVTNGQGDKLQRAKEVYVQFADGNQVPAKIVGADPNVDVALIKVDPRGLTLRPLPLAESLRGVRVGEFVAAIGSPFGEPQSLSVGVVSGLNRSIDSLAGRFSISGAIQTDAAINHGNSGGPLVDGAGRVLGINAQIESTGGGGEGVGFAVPIDAVRRSIDELRAHGEARYAYLGVSSVPVYPQLAQRFKLPVTRGAWVQEVSSGGPAAEADIRGGEGRTRFQTELFNEGGDVIVSVNGRPLTRDADLSAAIGRLSPGDTVRLDVRSASGARKTVRVRLGERPASSSG